MIFKRKNEQEKFNIIEQLKLKVGVLLNDLDKIEYFVENSNLSESSEFIFRKLIIFYRFKITQKVVDKFKDKDWFIDAYFMYADEKLIADEKNEYLIKKFAYEKKAFSPLKQEITSKEFLLKLINAGVNLTYTPIKKNLLIDNDYECFKLICDYKIPLV